MPKRQHVNATTTPEMRAFIRESDLPTAVLARLLKISEATVRKWRKRDNIEDASHCPKTLKTALSPAQEYVVVELRKRLLMSLDELLEICHEFIHPTISRAAMQRCLKRNGVSRLADMDARGQSADADQSVQVTLEDCKEHQAVFSEISPEAMKSVLSHVSDVDESEIVNVRVTKLPAFDSDENDATQQRLLVATDPQSRWVYVDIYDGDEKEAASRYMSHVLNKAPFHIRRILAGNYNEFLSRFRLLDDEAVMDDGETCDADI
ncbi:Uncharacterised protein [BD1-7 clade bacterium]|uniref:Uncharacterized protein n=1 Tax=BD1-7 clade bacterium TaxID=2029982 RepID=A0A5S9P5L5_9GAMM|nr:Uncharacterised protein [BD1-7 clade bacterium]CAA0098553.1 Uncharacterised protein [BD1-7 clade bacterium]